MQTAKKVAASPLLADVHYSDHTAVAEMSRSLVQHFQQARRKDLNLIPIFFMVGATSSTGDSLGPFVGWFLKRKGFNGLVMGDLESPVHASNLDDKLQEASRMALAKGKQPYIIAVDAAVGRPGRITVNEGPLRPGAGMGKNLPEVGAVHIMGGTASFPFLIWFAGLDQTVAMAEAIADALLHFYHEVSPGVPSR